MQCFNQTVGPTYHFTVDGMQSKEQCCRSIDLIALCERAQKKKCQCYYCQIESQIYGMPACRIGAEYTVIDGKQSAGERPIIGDKTDFHGRAIIYRVILRGRREDPAEVVWIA